MGQAHKPIAQMSPPLPDTTSLAGSAGAVTFHHVTSHFPSRLFWGQHLLLVAQPMCYHRSRMRTGRMERLAWLSLPPQTGVDPPEGAPARESRRLGPGGSQRAACQSALPIASLLGRSHRYNCLGTRGGDGGGLHPGALRSGPTRIRWSV